MKWFRLLVVVLVLVGILGVSVPAYADQADPDEPPTVKSFHVFRHLLETNDYLLIGYANIPYASTPNATVTDAFYWRLFDSANVTEIGWSTNYAFQDKGYGYNIFAFYFDNTSGPTWGEECYVRLDGNPEVFDTPPSYLFQVHAADYSTATTHDDSEIELKELILTLSADLAARWDLSSTNIFISEGETEQYLSLYGQAFWRGAIYGLQGLCPTLFPFTLGEIALDPRWSGSDAYSENYTTNLGNQWAGTWIEDAQDAGKVLFELDYDLSSILIVIVMAVGMLVSNVMLASDTWGGMLDVSVVLIYTSRLALFPLTFLGLLAAIGVIYVSIRIWGIGR